MKACFIAAGPLEWASSRMRAYWVVGKPHEQATERQWYAYDYKTFMRDYPSLNGKDFDAYIWQKNIDLNFVKGTQDKHHYWDVCDPLWWFSPREALDILEHMHGVVFSSQELANDFCQWGNVEHDGFVHVIPDRLDLSHFPTRKQHKQTAVTRFMWYGVAVNRQALYSTLANLERLKANGYDIELTIFDDRPDAQFTGVSFPVYHVRWQLDQENAVIANHDIALLPPYPGPWGKVKSNNKTLTANACGLPVTHGQDYYGLVELVKSHELRQEEATAGFMTVQNHYTVDKSAAEWEAILC